MGSEAKETPTNKLIMAIAENLQDAVVEMIHHAEAYGDTKFIGAIMDALEPEFDVADLRSKLTSALSASAELEKKLQAAEQRAAAIKTNTSVKLAEFAKLVDIIDAEAKRLGIEWHGSASTMLKAVIEAAKAAAVEDPTIKQDLTVVEDIVEYDGKRYRREAVARLPKKGEKFVAVSGGIIEAGIDFATYKHRILHEIGRFMDSCAVQTEATIREQAAEIERLKWEAARIQEVRDRIDTELCESTVKLPHRCSDDDWRLATCNERVLLAINEWEAISPAIERLKWLRQDMGYDEGTKLESTPGLALSRICCLRQWMADRDDRIAELTKQLSQSPAPAEASEGSRKCPKCEVAFYVKSVAEGDPMCPQCGYEYRNAPAPAVETGKWEPKCWNAQQFGVNKPDWLLFADGNGYTKEQAESAADWLNRRTEIESQLAQLSKYKRDAEAMEVIRDHGLSVTRGLFGVRLYQAVREAYRHDDNRSSYGNPADAVAAFVKEFCSPTAAQQEDGA